MIKIIRKLRNTKESTFAKNRHHSIVPMGLDGARIFVINFESLTESDIDLKCSIFWTFH